MQICWGLRPLFPQAEKALMSEIKAESCTGGLLSRSLSEGRGSFTVLEGSIVAHCPSLKTAAPGVSEQLSEDRMTLRPARTDDAEKRMAGRT